eukprot:TRINITY_DN15154_c0_g4_i1.p1 TRINITY_DN15154_c0_g4~~TRINITY_DN15154_c0_g4_i1.p1  ORF type:complete len:319 (+),score=77.32 TRINITY_DN15154_c0_g4_i1:1023-1979(+)
MVGVIGQHRSCAIQLLGHHQPHQHVRQRQRADRPLFVGQRRHFRRMPFRATDQERQVPALSTPVLQALRQLFGTELAARYVQCNDIGILRQRSDHPLAFVFGGATCVAPFATQAGLDLHQLEGQPVREPLLVFGKPLRHPTGRAFAGGDQAGFHQHSSKTSTAPSAPSKTASTNGSGHFVVVVGRRLVANGPQALERVELAHARQHHVHDDVAQVDQHPFGFTLAFNTQGHDVDVLGEAHDFVGDGLHMAGRSTRYDHHVVGDAGLAAYVDLDRVLGLQVFGGLTDAGQQFRHGGRRAGQIDLDGLGLGLVAQSGSTR